MSHKAVVTLVVGAGALAVVVGTLLVLRPNGEFIAAPTGVVEVRVRIQSSAVVEDLKVSSPSAAPLLSLSHACVPEQAALRDRNVLLRRDPGRSMRWGWTPNRLSIDCGPLLKAARDIPGVSSLRLIVSADDAGSRVQVNDESVAHSGSAFSQWDLDIHSPELEVDLVVVPA